MSITVPTAVITENGKQIVQSIEPKWETGTIQWRYPSKGRPYAVKVCASYGTEHHISEPGFYSINYPDKWFSSFHAWYSYQHGSAVYDYPEFFFPREVDSAAQEEPSGPTDGRRVYQAKAPSAAAIAVAQWNAGKVSTDESNEGFVYVSHKGEDPEEQTRKRRKRERRRRLGIVVVD